jgi:hypothetical protein
MRHERPTRRNIALAIVSTFVAADTLAVLWLLSWL